MQIIKYSEKILVWLHRNDKTMKWLSDELDQTRQSVSQKIKLNSFNELDKVKISALGFKD